MAVVKRSAVTIVGIVLVAAGVVLMPLPGPGILLVVAGLAVLATEYVWARKFLGRAKDEAEKAQEQAVASPPRTVATVLFGLGSLAVGIAMLVVDDVPWPVWDSTLDSVWTPVTGAFVVATSLFLLGTTTWTLRKERARDRSDRADPERQPAAR